MTGAGDVPAEAVRRVYPELVTAAIDTPYSAEVQGVVYAALMGAGVELTQLRGHYTDTVLTALGEAGWVLVPGPVHTEWATGRPGMPWETTIWADEAAARRMQHSDTVASRQVTDWRPAPEPTQDGDGR